VVDVVCGADTRRIRSLGHDRLPTYGVGKDKNKRQWRDLLDDLLAQGILVRTDERLPVLRLGAYAGEVLKGTRPVSVIRRELPREKPLGSTPPPAANSSLFERLRALRTALARKQGIPPYMVFADRTLRDMAARAPRDETAMLMVSGVGDAKLRRYGRVFLEEIERFTVETEPEIDD
jgi:ATP-dependent DNA helicase RecQ